MGKGKKFVALTAADCIEALRGRYRAPAYALLEQVANGTGWKADRFADAVVMSLWPSRGLTVTGFEVKVSRHDYQRDGGTNGKGKNEDANEEADEEADEEDEGEAHDGRHAQGEGEAHHQANEERP